jgi:hypothetical protein
MSVTEKISVTIDRVELAHAKRLASHLGLSLSGFITDAVRERIRAQARREAAREVIATFSAEDRASPEEARALLESWGLARPRVERRAKRKARVRRAVKGR